MKQAALSELQLPISVDQLKQILRAHGVLRASLFGSYARGQARADSDLDIVVEYDDEVSLFDHFKLKDELAQTTGKSVDLLSSRAISRHMRPYVDKDKVAIL